MASEMPQNAGGKAEKRRPIVEQITVERAIELLQLHKEGKLRGSPVLTVVRDPRDTRSIVSISLAESETFIPPEL